MKAPKIDSARKVADRIADMIVRRFLDRNPDVFTWGITTRTRADMARMIRERRRKK